jgi:glycosyltransferase involved in cell wall biosynthesis
VRIGINALAAENRSGTGRYTTELLKHLAPIDSENEYGVIVHENSPLCASLESFANFRLIKQPRRARPFRILWEQWTLPGLIARERFDVFHAPAFVLPRRSKARMVTTIHDLVFMRYPETFGYMRRNYFHWAIPRSAYGAARVIADSEATARDLVDLLQVRRDRIRVVPLGIGGEFFEPPGPEAIEQARAELRLPERYVLTVGTVEPRKNLVRLLQGFAIAKERLGRRCPALVLVGRKGWKYDDVFTQIVDLELRGDVIWTDFLIDETVRALYHHAAVFVYVSLHEGFGLPLLEAMASGVAVVASDCSSMPEVVGDAGVLADPMDPESIGEALVGLLKNDERCKDLAAKARERAASFSWEKTARMTLAVYQEAYKGPDGHMR